MTVLEELNELEALATRALANAKNTAELGEWKSAYLGKQGAFTRLSKGLGALPADERPLAGQKFNQARQKLEQALAHAEEQLKHAARMDELESDQVDVTLPGRAPGGRAGS
jgi:phenylalanyl-tRNA synthetase alpha chain